MLVGRQRKENLYLKNDFIAYLQNKNLSISSINYYLWNVELFMAWINKEEIQITKPDVLKYLHHLKENRNTDNGSRSRTLLSLNHYFTFLLNGGFITTNPTSLLKIRGVKKRLLYSKIFTPEELEQLLDNYYLLFIQNYDDSKTKPNMRQRSLLSRERNYIILSLLIHQGVTTREVDKILLTDIDFTKCVIKIRGGKKSNERTLALKAMQIGLLMRYVNDIRPLFFTYCADNDKLFFALPESGKTKTDTENVMHVFKPLSEKIKYIDKNFLNVKQIRASVITNWLKTEGLRKTQYLAGHRYISSTEKYLPNQIEGLIDDVAKFNPF